MTNLIISTVANSVNKDGKSLTNLVLPIPSGVKSLYWDGSKGWIENIDSNGVYIGNTNINALPDWANECASIYENALPPPPVPLTAEELCKLKAKFLLQQTDWVELPSVTNTANTPHLLNQSDFETYRIALRALAVNPVANPTWPTLPTPIWN